MVQNKRRKGVLPLALGSLPTLGGTRNSWGAGELVPLVSSSTQCLSQAADEPDEGPTVPKYAAEICFQLPLPTAPFFLRTLNSLPAFCFYVPKRTFVFYLRKELVPGVGLSKRQRGERRRGRKSCRPARGRARRPQQCRGSGAVGAQGIRARSCRAHRAIVPAWRELCGPAPVPQLRREGRRRSAPARGPFPLPEPAPQGQRGFAPGSRTCLSQHNPGFKDRYQPSLIRGKTQAHRFSGFQQHLPGLGFLPHLLLNPPISRQSQLWDGSTPVTPGTTPRRNPETPLGIVSSSTHPNTHTQTRQVMAKCIFLKPKSFCSSLFASI